MKTNYLIPLLLMVVSSQLSAQCSKPGCVSHNMLNISTGIDPATGAFLPTGSIDPSWQLANDPPLTTNFDANITFPNANVISGGLGEWLNLNGCNPGPCGILSADVNRSLPGNTLAGQPFEFRRYFCVCERSKITLSGQARIDDYGSLNIYSSNGNPIYSPSLPIALENCMGENCTLNASFELDPGTYYIEVEVNNTGGPVGDYCGFVINGQLSTEQNSLSNFNESCCIEIEPPASRCCPDLRNLILNPHFDEGNNLFISQYTHDSSPPATGSLMPGEYGIFSSSQLTEICPEWHAQDPSTCNPDGNFLVVNGATGQSTGMKLVWEQQIDNLKPWKEYKFCANFKNLSQCCFDVKPVIDIRFSIGGNDVSDVEIDVPAGAICNWQEISASLNAGDYSGDLTIQIWLDESGIGDGNDLAIDNISLVELPQADITYADFSISRPVPVSGNLVNMLFEAAPMPSNCGCSWEVCELNDAGDCIPETVVSNNPTWWQIPNYCDSFDFAGYNGSNNLSGLSNPGVFDRTKTYRIKRGVFCDCMGWNEESHDIFTNNNLLIVRETKTGKIVQRIPIPRKRR